MVVGKNSSGEMYPGVPTRLRMASIVSVRVCADMDDLDLDSKSFFCLQISSSSGRLVAITIALSIATVSPTIICFRNTFFYYSSRAHGFAQT